jgi:MFS family permease
MMVLRLFAGSIVHHIPPLKLLAVSSAVACMGLLLLSVSAGIMVLVAATLFALGKTFFWPTMLAVVSERFPKGGALTLNITGGVGMMAAGVIGAVIVGFVQDTSITKKLKQEEPALHAAYATEDKKSIFGDYQSIDQPKLSIANPEDQARIVQIQEVAKKEALQIIAIFPVIMFISYLFLIFYHKAKGGYKIIVLEDNSS